MQSSTAAAMRVVDPAHFDGVAGSPGAGLSAIATVRCRHRAVAAELLRPLAEYEAR